MVKRLALRFLMPIISKNMSWSASFMTKPKQVLQRRLHSCGHSSNIPKVKLVWSRPSIRLTIKILSLISPLFNRSSWDACWTQIPRGNSSFKQECGIQSGHWCWRRGNILWIRPSQGLVRIAILLSMMRGRCLSMRSENDKHPSVYLALTFMETRFLSAAPTLNVLSGLKYSKS